MSVTDDIANSIGELARHSASGIDNPHSIVGSIVSIDSANTCTIQPQDTNRTVIQNVLLTSDSGVAPTYVPAIGTQVIVSLFGPNSGFLAQHGAVQSVALAVGTSNYGGLVKVTDVVSRLNKIENKVNDIISKYNTHTHAGVTSGGAVTAVPTPLEVGTLTPTVNSDIENTVVTHGNGQTNKTAYVASAAAIQTQIDTLQSQINGKLLQQVEAQGAINSSNNASDPVGYKQAQGRCDALNDQISALIKQRSALYKQLNDINSNPPQ